MPTMLSRSARSALSLYLFTQLLLARFLFLAHRGNDIHEMLVSGIRLRVKPETPFVPRYERLEPVGTFRGFDHGIPRERPTLTLGQELGDHKGIGLVRFLLSDRRPRELFRKDWVQNLEHMAAGDSGAGEGKMIARRRLASHGQLPWEPRSREPGRDRFLAVLDLKVLLFGAQVGEHGVELRLAHVKSQVLHIGIKRLVFEKNRKRKEKETRCTRRSDRRRSTLSRLLGDGGPTAQTCYWLHAIRRSDHKLPRRASSLRRQLWLWSVYTIALIIS